MVGCGSSPRTGRVEVGDPEQFDFRRFPVEKTRYIFDYEISGSPVTGLDLITSNSLGSRAVLVTSHFNDTKIQRVVENAGALMMPKFLIPTIEIVKGNSSFNFRSETNACYMVLIDDDPMIREHWEEKAKESGLTIHAVPEPSALDISKFNFSTPIYIDLNLDGMSGLTVAQELHDKGYKEIFLSTGSVLKASQVPNFIRGIINKDFPPAINTS